MGLVKKSESPWRWLILLLTCVMMIGNYYSYDNPAALKTQIDDYMGDPDDFETLYSLLYTVYSVPNVFLPFFGGYFVDRFGVRICLIAFCIFLAVGQRIFAIGLSMKSWPVMYVGRVVFGFGGESLSVANSALLADWFEGKELAFAFGLNLSIARLGSVINNIVSPSLANSVSLQFALWFSAMLCGTSVGCALAISPIDASLDKAIKRSKPTLTLDDNDSVSDINNPLLDEREFSAHAIESQGQRSISDSDKLMAEKNKKEKEDDEVEIWEASKFGEGFWLLVISCVVVYGCVLPFNNIASSLLLERDYFMDPIDGCHLEDPNQCQSDTNPPVDCDNSKWYQPPLPDDITKSDIDCTDDEWSGDDACTYEFCHRQDDATVKATQVMSIPYIISACLSPVLGKVVDNFGRRAIIATAAPILLIAVHTSLGYSDVTPELPLAGQGIAYAGFAAVLWPSVPLVVEKRLTGLAYGVCTSIQNIGLACFPLIVATIYSDNNDEYIPYVEVFFVSLAVLGTVVGFYMNYYDAKHDNVFNRIGTPEDEFDVGGGRDSEYRTFSRSSFSQAEAAASVQSKVKST
jgi:MFS family permease